MSGFMYRTWPFFLNFTIHRVEISCLVYLASESADCCSWMRFVAIDVGIFLNFIRKINFIQQQLFSSDELIDIIVAYIQCSIPCKKLWQRSATVFIILGWDTVYIHRTMIRGYHFNTFFFTFQIFLQLHRGKTFATRKKMLRISQSMFFHAYSIWCFAHEKQ